MVAMRMRDEQILHRIQPQPVAHSVRVCVGREIEEQIFPNERLRARAQVYAAQPARLFAGVAAAEHRGEALRRGSA